MKHRAEDNQFDDLHPAPRRLFHRDQKRKHAREKSAVNPPWNPKNHAPAKTAAANGSTASPVQRRNSAATVPMHSIRAGLVPAGELKRGA